MEEVAVQSTVPAGPPPEPPDGLAHELELDAKFARAAIEKRRRIEEKATAGKPTMISDAIRAMMSDAPAPGAPVERIPFDEGDFPDESLARRATIAQLIPARFSDASFASYEPQTASQRTTQRIVERWVDAAKAGTTGPMLAIIGPKGVGKSHLLYAAARGLLASGMQVYARPWYRLADELRYGGESPFVAGKNLDAHEVRATLWRYKVVLLDEVRPTASTAFDDTELAKFACHAYDSRIAVMITTNVAPLELVMGGPAASRFREVTIDGPDRRATGGESARATRSERVA